MNSSWVEIFIWPANQSWTLSTMIKKWQKTWRTHPKNCIQKKQQQHQMNIICIHQIYFVHLSFNCPFFSLAQSPSFSLPLLAPETLLVLPISIAISLGLSLSVCVSRVSLRFILSSLMCVIYFTVYAFSSFSFALDWVKRASAWVVTILLDWSFRCALFFLYRLR